MSTACVLAYVIFVIPLRITLGVASLALVESYDFLRTKWTNSEANK